MKRNKDQSNVRLIKDRGSSTGYFIEVKDKYTENRLAITEHELLLIWAVVKDEVLKIIEPKVEIEEAIERLSKRISLLENKEEKYPVKQGERVMYAILGIGGGIYGFSTTPDQAEKTRDLVWNIGQRKPKKYVVSFKEV